MTEATCTTCGHGTANADGTCGPCRAVLGRQTTAHHTFAAPGGEPIHLRNCPGCKVAEGRETTRLPFDGQARCECKAMPVGHRINDACMALLDAQPGRKATDSEMEAQVGDCPKHPGTPLRLDRDDQGEFFVCDRCVAGRRTTPTLDELAASIRAQEGQIGQYLRAREIEAVAQWLEHWEPSPPARTATSCVAPDCTYSAADGSAYCALHGVKWGRGGCVHAWTALRSIPPSWRCAYCGEVTEVRP